MVCAARALLRPEGPAAVRASAHAGGAHLCSARPPPPATDPADRRRRRDGPRLPAPLGRAQGPQGGRPPPHTHVHVPLHTYPHASGLLGNGPSALDCPARTPPLTHTNTPPPCHARAAPERAAGRQGARQDRGLWHQQARARVARACTRFWTCRSRYSCVHDDRCVVAYYPLLPTDSVALPNPHPQHTHSAAGSRTPTAATCRSRTRAARPTTWRQSCSTAAGAQGAARARGAACVAARPAATAPCLLGGVSLRACSPPALRQWLFPLWLS